MVLQLGACLHPVNLRRGDLFSRSADNLQQEKEDLDNVDIDGERSKHVLLWADGVLPVPY